MREKNFTITEKTKKRTKSIVLSIVALLELILLVTSVTFSWFEGLTSMELEGYDFNTASVLNSHVELGENKTTEDNTYSEIIDLSSFFDAQKEVRLSPVSSADAKNFYAAYDGTPTKSNYTSLHYRKLSKEDVNSNIIQFEFNISSPDGDMDVYLTEVLPVVNIDGHDYYSNQTLTGSSSTYNARKANPYRFAFSDGTETHILRIEDYLKAGSGNDSTIQESIVELDTDDTIKTISGSLTNKTIGSVERAQEYAYYTDHRTTTTGMGETDAGTPDGATIKPLFHLDKNETKTITVSVWIEALDYESLNNTAHRAIAGQTISFSVKLCTSWSITREITVYDKTADCWIDTADDNSQTTALFVRNADGDSDNRQYKLTHEWDSENECNKWTGKIPIALHNCEFLWGTIQNDRVNPSETWAKFQALNRGNSTEITMLGIDSACVWDLKPEDLIEIDFRDYTSTSWVAKEDELGNDIDMNVEITYDGRILDYSMTATPTQDDYSKNSWSCWIPNDVNQVDFIRSGYNTAGNYTDFNRWIGSDRNGETVYRATTESDGNTNTGTDSKYVLYVKIDDAIAETFYANNRGKNPAISFTGDANRALWDGTDNKTTISRYDYKPNQDTWPNGESELTRVSADSNIWYMSFEQKPADGTYVTVWSRSGANDFNDVDTDMSFGVFYLFEANKNYTTINLTTAQKLTSDGASNNYALDGTMDSSGAGAGSSGGNTGSSDIETGVWGELATLPTGSYDSSFIHTDDVDLVKVTFTYGGVEFTMKMEKSTADTTGRTWITNVMPDSGVTNIKFTDSNGNTWTDPGTSTRNKTLKRTYFYAKDTNGNSTGWIKKLTPASGSGTIYYFKHYNTATTAMTVSFVTAEGVPFSFSLTKGSDNKTWSTNSTNIPDDATSVKYSDGTRTWSIGNISSSTPYCYALDNNQYELKDTANYARIYLERNYTWSDIKIYYTGTGAPSWDGSPAMTDLGRNLNGSPLYCYLVPTDAGLIIFRGTEGGADKQTVDLTSNHNVDMIVFKFSNWNGSKGECTNSALDASNLN